MPTDRARPAGIAIGPSLTLERDGATRLDAAAAAILPALRVFADAQPRDRAGVRLHGVAALRPLLTLDGLLGALAAAAHGGECRAVRAILFDKTAAANWSLGWHQDRTIVVQDRVDLPGFGPWTIKAGRTHVEPPPALLAGMLTMRVHLDDVPADNAPLLIAPGSHRLGRVREADIASVVSRCGVTTCLAAAGDVWLYATPILHASAAAARPARRRVLQVDFAAVDLPDGLRWLEM